MQKEASLPGITLSEKHRVGGTLEYGWNVLAGCNSRRIVQHISDNNRLPDKRDLYGIM